MSIFRLKFSSIIYSLLFSVAALLPLYSSIGFRKTFWSSIVLSIPVFILVITLLKFVYRLNLVSQKFFSMDSCVEDSVCGVHRTYVGAFLLIVLLWGIVFLVYYPGCCSGDSHDILKMVLHMDFTSSWFRYTSFNSHHPWLYSLLVKLGQIIAPSVDAGIAIVIFVQLLVMAATVVHSCHTVFLLSKSTFLTVAYYLFFTLNPLLIRLTLSLWKDALFGAFVLLLTSLVLRVFFKHNVGHQKYDNFLIIICAVLVSLLRSGGVLIPFVLMIGFFLIGENKKRVLIIIGSVIGIVLAAQVITGALFKIEKGHFSEAIGVPLQQVSRVIVEDGKLKKEERDFLNNLLPLDQYQSHYEEKTANGIKFANDFSDDFLEQNKGTFLKYWLYIGIRNPKEYITAWIEETKGFWYIGTDTAHYVASPGYQLDNTIDTKITNSKLPFIPYAAIDYITEFYIICTKCITKASSLFWLLLFALAASFIMKKRFALIITLPQIIWFALFIMNAPVYQQFRYIFSSYLVFPLICVLFFVDNNCMSFDSEKGEHDGSNCSASTLL